MTDSIAAQRVEAAAKAIEHVIDGRGTTSEEIAKAALDAALSVPSDAGELAALGDLRLIVEQMSHEDLIAALLAERERSHSAARAAASRIGELEEALALLAAKDREIGRLQAENETRRNIMASTTEAFATTEERHKAELADLRQQLAAPRAEAMEEREKAWREAIVYANEVNGLHGYLPFHVDEAIKHLHAIHTLRALAQGARG